MARKNRTSWGRDDAQSIYNRDTVDENIPDMSRSPGRRARRAPVIKEASTAGGVRRTGRGLHTEPGELPPTVRLATRAVVGVDPSLNGSTL
ncbi:hypothetical protein EVAR_25674_1 [Eumeta japonica]|uniref:Uncharacterized protein n=1 Tax=Eumeta variegata TaxID=151549 RepID=A0A4C1WF34_EUMVA|nr:hypothetical protein EVAR_25674_1 [Eumeta japonica]